MSAKRLTVSKAPLPVAYREAIKALERCQDIDEAKEFIDQAEALAAWARIYKKNEAGKQARALRLHAYRRMGELAQELAPRKGTSKGGSQPGPVALLKSVGMSRHHADAANHLAKMPDDNFSLVVNQDVPPAPTSVVRRLRQPDNLSSFSQLKARQNSPFACRRFITEHRPQKLARMVSNSEIPGIRRTCEATIQWLQAFLRALPR